jgi:hypothetical protein
MVERQARELIDRVPFGLARVVGSSGLYFSSDHGGKSYANGMATRIAAWVAEGSDLFELYSLDSGLFFELARGRRLERFVLVNEPARERPHAFKGGSRAPYQEHFYLAASPAKQCHINRHGWARMVVAVLASFFLLHPLSSRSKAS